MFQFHPDLQSKKDGNTRVTTPRNLVVPDATDDPNPGQHGVAMETMEGVEARPNSSRGQPKSKLPPSSRKYLAASPDASDDTSTTMKKEPLGLSTGLPSPQAALRQPGDSASSRGPANRSRSVVAPLPRTPRGRRTLRGSIHHLRHTSVQITAAMVRTSRHLYRHLSLQQLLAYLLILFGLLSESFTPAPRYNVPIGIVLFMVTSTSSSSSSSSSSSTASELDHRLVVAGLCLTTIMDIMWLLRPQEGSFNGYFRVQMANATHLCLAVCAAIKLWLLFSTYFDLGPETTTTTETTPTQQRPGLRGRLWDRLRFFLPRKTLPKRSHLSYEVLMRVLALIWIHGLCGLALLALSLISVMALSGKPVFRSAALGLPLPLAMLFKSASTLLSYFLATHTMSYHGCLKVSGCDTLAKYHEDSASEIVLKYNAKWMRHVKHAKVVDALLGVYLAAVYYSAVHSTTFISVDTVVSVLVATVVILLVVDVWTPLLIMVVARCGEVLHSHHRNGMEDVDPYFPNQLEWEDDDDDVEGGGKKKKKKGSSSSSGSSDSSDDDDEDGSSVSSSSGSESRSHSSSSSTGQQRRRSSSGGPASTRKSSSRKPLIPPPVKRKNSLLIIDACDLGDHPDGDQLSAAKSYWVRYWDDASGRSYLVHSTTNETIWEIGGIASPSSPRFFGSDLTPAVAGPRTSRGLQSASSFPPMYSARDNSARGQGGGRLLSARASSSHPTSESDVLVTTPIGPPLPPAPAATSNKSSRRSSSSSSLLLSAENFMVLWDSLPDGGSFTCRVSKVPTSNDLRLHLHSHGFTVASDALNVANLRRIHFFSLVGNNSPSSSSSRTSSRTPPVASFFLGEFLVDSLSLKLFAKFRCHQVDAIVPFVKKLQLKEIVGAYAPCD